jgi:hypothetical protein
MKDLPFSITGEAVNELKRILRDQDGMEIAIVATFGEGYVNQQDGKEYWDQEIFFALGWHPEGQRPRDSFFKILGYSVSIMPSTLEHLEGKKLGLQPRRFGMRPKLVAI